MHARNSNSTKSYSCVVKSDVCISCNGEITKLKEWIISLQQCVSSLKQDMATLRNENRDLQSLVSRTLRSNVYSVKSDSVCSNSYSAMVRNGKKCSSIPNSPHGKPETTTAAKNEVSQAHQNVINEPNIACTNKFSVLLENTDGQSVLRDSAFKSDQVCRSECLENNRTLRNTAVKNDYHYKQQCNNVNKVSPDHISSILLADSHGRGLAEILRFQHNASVTSVVKPGACLQEVLKSHTNNVSQNQCMILLGGSNDVYKNELKAANRVLRETLTRLSDKKAIVVGIPHRHDLIESSCVNREIHKANRTFSKICKSSSNAYFLSIDDLERKNFTTHGMHLNKSGKSLLSQRINILVQGVFFKGERGETVALPYVNENCKLTSLSTNPAAASEHKSSAAEANAVREEPATTTETTSASATTNSTTARCSTLPAAHAERQAPATTTETTSTSATSISTATRLSTSPAETSPSDPTTPIAARSAHPVKRNIKQPSHLKDFLQPKSLKQKLR